MSVPCWLWLESLWWLCTDELPLFHGQDQVIFSRDAEDAVQTQPQNVPKLLSFTFKGPEVVA